MADTLTAEELLIVRAALERGVDEHDIAYDLDVPIELVEAARAVNSAREGE